MLHLKSEMDFTDGNNNDDDDDFYSAFPKICSKCFTLQEKNTIMKFIQIKQICVLSL